MALDLAKLNNIVTARLGANTRTADGTPNFTAAVGDKARAPEEIEANIYQAAMTVARAVCESDSNAMRAEFLTAVALTHAETLPEHYGDTSIPEIVPFESANFVLRGVRRSFDKIETYRNNFNLLYSDTAHDQQITDSTGDDNPNGRPSSLAGFYDIVNNIFYFTGFSASMTLAQFSSADVLSKLAEALEPVVARLACGLSAKDGDLSDGLFAQWYAQAGGELNEIRQGGNAFPPLDESVKMRGGRT